MSHSLRHRIFHATPDSLVTYNATITAEDHSTQVVATIKFRLYREEGQIQFNSPPCKYNINHKPYSGRWTVQKGEGISILTAHKPKWYRNMLLIKIEDKTYEITRSTIWNRNYVVCRIDNDAGENKKHQERGDRVGEITADGIFSRSYKLSFDDSVNKVFQVFCYWWIILMNKRSDN